LDGNLFWNTERLLANIDEEVYAVLELGQAKGSLISSLFEVARVLTIVGHPRRGSGNGLPEEGAQGVESAIR